jgi:predicted GNAT family acetyltransferase
VFDVEIRTARLVNGIAGDDTSRAMTNAKPAPVLSDATEANRFEARFDDELAGFVDYRRLGGRLVLLHTEVLPAFEGRGVGSALAAHIFEGARTAAERVSVKCPFIAAWVRRHPEVADLVVVPRGS